MIHISACKCPSTCLCGKNAVATAFLPIPNVFSGLKQVTEPHRVCQYHAQKSKTLGYEVVYD